MEEQSLGIDTGVTAEMLDTKDYSGRKYDSGKIMLELLAPNAIEGMGRVLTFGAKKYGPHNWRAGIAWSRIIGSLLRHLFAIMRGEDIDPESGELHADHVLTNAMFLSQYFRDRREFDDRYYTLIRKNSSEC